MTDSKLDNESFKYNTKTFNNIDEIMKSWSQIDFPKHKPKLKSIDKIETGKSIKKQRLYHNMSLKVVENLLNICEATLKSYESGTRLTRLDEMYGLSQIYNMTIDDFIQGNA